MTGQNTQVHKECEVHSEEIVKMNAREATLTLLESRKRTLLFFGTVTSLYSEGKFSALVLQVVISRPTDEQRLLCSCV